MDIRINLIHYPLYVLGEGKRVGIWVQGCSLGCKGCLAEHTWSKEGGELYTVETLSNKILAYKSDKVTIVGGEPFEQPLALQSLLISLRKGGVDDILVYSGFEYAFLQKNHAPTLKLIDALIVGRFEIDKPTKYIYKGSENQKMIILNREKEQSYQRYTKETKRRLQVVENEGVFVLGIPNIHNETITNEKFYHEI